MTQDVKQWLTEIKLLQKKSADSQQERDEAFASASNWRNLYETEAKQRRTEANLARQTIEALQAKVQTLQQSGSAATGKTDAEIKQQVESFQTIEALKHELLQALTECDRLTQALKAEQIAHAHTRRSLTTALGDTIDRLNYERSSRIAPLPEPSPPPPPPKIPSLELPPLN